MSLSMFFFFFSLTPRAALLFDCAWRRACVLTEATLTPMRSWKRDAALLFDDGAVLCNRFAPATVAAADASVCLSLSIANSKGSMYRDTQTHEAT